MAYMLAALLPLASLAASQTPTATAPLIINQGPTQRCWYWYSEPAGNGYPPTREASCAGPDMYGKFTLAEYGWMYPAEYNTSPGFAGSVDGVDGSPLTVSLTNNAKNADCGRALEVNLSFDYPGASLYSNVSTTDLAQYDSIIIEYDIHVSSATTAMADCSCMNDGSPICPSWWKSQFTTDILFYQGTNNPQDFNVISVRHFDPQKYGVVTFNAAGGYRYQYSDGQIPATSGATAHVKLDAKHLIAQYSSQLCQGGGINGPIYLRSIQLVAINTGTDTTVQISNVKANAFQYAPGTFTSSAVDAGCTPTNCPTQPTDPKSSCASWTPSATDATPAPMASLYGQCGGSGWQGPTNCPSGSSCQNQNDYYSQCLGA